MHNSSDEINVTVWDEDVMTDDKVGEANVRLSELISGGSGASGAKIDIFYKNKKAGKVTFRSKWYPDSGSPKHSSFKSSPKISGDKSGNMNLTVVEAELKRDTETFSKMDPYAVLTVKSQKYRTKTLDGAGKKPKWNQSFDIYVASTSDDMVVTVWDEDVTSDDKVGEATVKIHDLITMGSGGAWIDIFWKGKKAGKVMMKVTGFFGSGGSPKKTKEVSSGWLGKKKEKVHHEVHAHVVQTSHHTESRSYTYQNGSTYVGEWQGIRRHGKGTFKQPSGSVYTGEFHNDRRHGRGQLQYPDGCKYTGEWRDDLRVGQGLFEWLDGNTYDGEFKEDQMNGSGTFTWRSGAKYVGEWRHNKKNGKGTMYYRDGSVYVGKWKDDRRDGEGVMTWKNGAKYDGQFHNDIKHGHGCYTWENNCKYHGDWVNGRRTGQGVCTYPDGGKYEGSFKNNVKDGQGTFQARDGSSYNGEWKNDEKEGRGVFTWSDRTTFNGYWCRGDMKSGKLIGPDGREQDM